MVYFRPCCRRDREPVIPYLVRIFHACLSTGYVPAVWRQVKVVFITKPGRNSYSGPRDFRSTSLTSFFLKNMERLVDRYLSDEALAQVPLHPNQHAYQAGKSVEMVSVKRNGCSQMPESHHIQSISFEGPESSSVSNHLLDYFLKLEVDHKPFLYIY